MSELVKHGEAMKRIEHLESLGFLEAILEEYLRDCFLEKPLGYQSSGSDRLAEKSESVSENGRQLKQRIYDFELKAASYTLSDIAIEGKVLRSIEVFKRRFQSAEWTQESAQLLFHGLPGTGKTMAAEALAGDLGKQFIIVSGGEIEDKYFGEAEKKLTRVFEIVREGGAVLVLDEVDSLLRRRDRASHDHYANLTNHLLRLLETGVGLIVLCTNHLQGLDPAVLRRMSQRIEFRIPGPEVRVKIWSLHLSNEVDAVRLSMARFLSVFPLTGGLIRNAVEHAYAEKDYRKGAHLRLIDLLIGVAPQLEEMRYMLEQYNVQISISPSGTSRPLKNSDVGGV